MNHIRFIRLNNFSEGLLGRYFQDHPARAIADVLPRNRRKLHMIFDNVYLSGFKYQPRFRLNGVKQREAKLLGAGGVLLFQTRQQDTLNRTRTAGRNILKGNFDLPGLTDLAANMFRAGPIVAQQVWRKTIKHRAYNPDDLGIRLGVQVEQEPRSASRVSLTNDIDALGMLRARLDWQLGQTEIDTIAGFAEVTKTAFESVGLAEVRIDRDVAERSRDVLDLAGDHSHHMGTARMGISREYGVVDTNLQIFGAENVYVCSSAVYPTSSFSNPTHTLIALAFRLADHLHEGMGRE